MNNKYLHHSMIDEIVASQKKLGRKIVLCHGVFDLVHPGHLEHLIQAKKFGDTLIVSITCDQHVNKGPKRPHFSEQQRLKFLAEFSLIDYVVISNQPTALEVIDLIKPDFYVKGPDYSSVEDETGNMDKEKNLVTLHGGETVFTSGFTSSSSELLLGSEDYFTYEQINWLNQMNLRFSKFDFESWISKLDSLRPMVLGELIIDEYITCKTLGKSSKYPVLAFEKTNLEKFPGGALAVADICSSFCSDVQIPIVLENEIDSHSFSNFDTSLRIINIKEENRFPITKKRFVEGENNLRLLELYEYTPSHFNNLTYDQIASHINNDKHPLLIADYGHGFFESKFIRTIMEKDRYFCINTQANAGNYGYNTISKYPKADFISINGGELELELHSKNIDYSVEIPKRMASFRARHAVVTIGADGLLVFDNSNFIQVPAFANKLVDKVGAGDSVFSISSLLSYLDAPLEVIGLCASLLAANEIISLGHRVKNHKAILRKSLKSVLK